MKKVCPKDRNHNLGISVGDTFCYLCGVKLEDFDSECQCGKDLSVCDHFCPDCGRPIK